MLVGVPKEIKNHEYRVGLTPAGVRELLAHGHEVIVQSQAGSGIGIADDAYVQAGAHIKDTAAEIFSLSELIIKVKEPQPQECEMLRPGQLLFTYLHLAADPQQTALLMASGATCIAYETVTDSRGQLPLLAPMSEVAGRMSIQEGAKCLEKAMGGRGMLLGGVPGVQPAKVLVLGGGVVGLNAARMAMGLGAQVIVFDKNLRRLQEIDELYGNQLITLYSTQDAIESHLPTADLVIGAVLVPGAAAPKLITEQMLPLMQPGAVLVDVAIDQGGCFETSHATTHQHPTYTDHGVVHYCVANMPGGVARTSTFALTNATLPYVLKLADLGLAALEDEHLLAGLSVYQGDVVNKEVAQALDYQFVDVSSLLAGLKHGATSLHA